MRYEFVAERHNEFGSMGWRLKDMPDFDPLPGMAVAHDILEHFPGGDESPADEFQALGASWFLRGEGYLYSGLSSGEENLAADMPDIVDHVLQGMYMPTPPRTHRLDSNAEDALQIALKLAKRNCGDRGADAEAKSVLRKALGWLRIGYRRAVRRYKDNVHNARHLFTLIEAEADKYLKHAEEGDELHIGVVLANGRCDVKFKPYQPEW